MELEGGVNRKLAAILCADVVGYSRLMQADEPATVETLKQYRAAIGRVIERHKGRVVNAPGDSILAEFPSAVEAVQAAVEIQKSVEGRNVELPPARRMEFRIGVNLGDVIEEEDGTIYGDGVNIAARMEALAEAGGICISSSVFDAVEGKLEFGFDFLGERQVKNIARPVSVYRVRSQAAPAAPRTPGTRRARLGAIAAAGVVILVAGAVAVWQLYPRPAPPPTELALGEAPALELPAKPSIAVLPFKNLGDPEQERFVDAFTDEIITELSRFHELFVVASNSVFTYKGKAVKVQEVARELGVQYVLEGNVERAGDRLRVTAQLVDAITGHHVWVESYDRNADDLFAVRDEVIEEIVGTLGSTERGPIAGDVAKRAKRKTTEDLNAYEYVVLANEHQIRYTKEDTVIGRGLAERAIELDPMYARAHRLLAWLHFQDMYFDWSDSPEESGERAFEAAQKAVELDPGDGRNYWALGYMRLWIMRQHEKAIAEYERALTLNPNDADLLADWGFSLAILGRAEESLELIAKAMRLNPHYPDWYDWALGTAYYNVRRYDEAIAALQRMQNHNVDSSSYLAASYAQLGRIEEAQPEVEKIIELDPEFSIADWAEKQPYPNQADLDHYIDGLRKAGLPE